MADWPRVFVVIGSRGEYSDAREWPVVAYSGEEPARLHCEAAAARGRVIYQAATDLQGVDWDAYETLVIDLTEGPAPPPPEWVNEFDPEPLDHHEPFRTGDDPADYSLYEVDLRDAAAAPSFEHG